jgi:hypothetical protein
VSTTGLLPALRAKFPKAKFHYEPTPGCKRCSGAGVEPPKKTASGLQLNEGPCACVFLGPNTNWLLPLIHDSARKTLTELREGRERG